MATQHGTDDFDYLFGGPDDDAFFGHGSTDILSGGGGNDLLDGGDDDDILEGGTGVDLLVGGNGNDVVLSQEADADADTLLGGEGNDTLAGNAEDHLEGGAGNDVYLFENGVGTVVEQSDGGLDTLVGSSLAPLPSNIDFLVMTGVQGFGNELGNGIFGNENDNLIDGMQGADYMAGGAGNDVYRVDDADDWVHELADGELVEGYIDRPWTFDNMPMPSFYDLLASFGPSGIDTVISTASHYTMSENVENLVLEGGAVSGTGNASANQITGNAQDNRLEGGGGQDVLVGGAGNDTLLGGVGGDTLRGGTGADLMEGGQGDDTYYVDNAGDVVSESSGQGRDIVASTVSYALSAHVEDLRVYGAGSLDATGNELDNVLYASDGNNRIDGGRGQDTASYRFATAGVQIALGHTTYTQDTGGSGIDTLRNIENLEGSAFDDVLSGNEKNNRLTGGAGSDTYRFGRGSGRDTVVEAADTVGEDVVQFGPGIAADQLWFSQQGDNLVVGVIGTADQLTIAQWFGAGQAPVEHFRASDGEALLASEVHQLVQAMAAFAPPPVGQTTLAEPQRVAFGDLIASAWS